MGKNFRDTLNEQLRDPAFRAEWEALEPERKVTMAILDGRTANHIYHAKLDKAKARGT